MDAKPNPVRRRHAPGASDGAAGGAASLAAAARKARAGEEEDELHPPLRPPPWSLESLELAFNRFGRVFLAACVPALGVPCLARALVLLRNAPLCIRKESYHRKGFLVPCHGGDLVDDIDWQSQWPHCLFGAWVTVQFVYNFAEACFKEPGFVLPPADKEGGKDKHYPVYARVADGGDRVEAIANYAQRWCPNCGQPKPPRAHHSSRVGCCVLRMDHYCTTTDNIAGARNHGHYVLVVLFAGLGLAYAACVLLSTTYWTWDIYWRVFSRFKHMAMRRSENTLLMLYHAFEHVYGPAVMAFCVVAAISAYMLQPLVDNVLIASHGVTVLEATAPRPTKDGIVLPGGRGSLLVPLGGFSHGSRLRNWRALLGPRYLWRLLCPVRGGADACEEDCPVLNDAFAGDVRAALRKGI